MTGSRTRTVRASTVVESFGCAQGNLPAVEERERAAFTLVELLVVVAIIALLLAILLPALNRAKQTARMVKCQSNVRQLAVGMNMYLSEDPGAELEISATGSSIARMGTTWYAIGQLYAMDSAVPGIAYCPDAGAGGYEQAIPPDPDKWTTASGRIDVHYVTRRGGISHGWPERYVTREMDATPKRSYVTLRAAPPGMVLFVDRRLQWYDGTVEGTNITLEHMDDQVGTACYMDGHAEAWDRGRIIADGAKAVGVTPSPRYLSGFIEGYDLPGARGW